jgi:hypothetical protein
LFVRYGEVVVVVGVGGGGGGRRRREREKGASFVNVSRVWLRAPLVPGGHRDPAGGDAPRDGNHPGGEGPAVPGVWTPDGRLLCRALLHHLTRLLPFLRCLPVLAWCVWVQAAEHEFVGTNCGIMVRDAGSLGCVVCLPPPPPSPSPFAYSCPQSCHVACVVVVVCCIVCFRRTRWEPSPPRRTCVSFAVNLGRGLQPLLKLLCCTHSCGTWAPVCFWAVHLRAGS